MRALRKGEQNALCALGLVSVRATKPQKKKKHHNCGAFYGLVNNSGAKSNSYTVYLATAINQAKSKLYIPQIQVQHS